MYDDAVQAIHDHLIQKSMTSGLTYTSELIPERDPTGQMYVFPPASPRNPHRFVPAHADPGVSPRSKTSWFASSAAR